MVALGWQDADGTLGRIQLDLGSDRGYGITAFPDAAPGPLPTTAAWPALSQGFGYVQWQNGRRKFTALKVWGVINFVEDIQSASATIGMSNPALGPWTPHALFARLAIDGVGPSGEPLCHVIALHAASDHERTDSYDPEWLKLSPSALIVDGASAPPSYADDPPLTAHLVAPDSGHGDPGGSPPSLLRHASSVTPDITILLGVGGGDNGGCD